MSRSPPSGAYSDGSYTDTWETIWPPVLLAGAQVIPGLGAYGAFVGVMLWLPPPLSHLDVFCSAMGRAPRGSVPGPCQAPSPRSASDGTRPCTLGVCGDGPVCLLRTQPPGKPHSSYPHAFKRSPHRFHFFSWAKGSSGSKPRNPHRNDKTWFSVFHACQFFI